jgi:hypothetical protein
VILVSYYYIQHLATLRRISGLLFNVSFWKGWPQPAFAHRKKKRAARETISGGKDMALHKVNELGWVAAWIGFIIFLFAIFIPTVNRSLNL